MPPEVKDDTTKVVDDKGLSAAVVKPTEPDEKTQAALDAQETLGNLLKDQGFDSVEDLAEAMKSDAELRKGLGDLDLEEVLEKGKELDRVHAYWADEETKKTGDEEDADDKIARLEKEVKGIHTAKKDEDDRKKAIDENQKILTDFSNEVTSFVKKEKDYPEEYRPFTELLLGINNPANEIDITDKMATKQMCNDGLKKVRDFEQVVIKRYIDGKIKVPPITKVEAPGPETKYPVAKNLKEAKKTTGEILTKLFSG